MTASSPHELQIWVWGLEDEFGYVVARLEVSSALTIVRKVSRFPTPWLDGVHTDRELLDALVSRSSRTVSSAVTGDASGFTASRYRFYRAMTAQPPLCFPSLLHWLWYLDGDRREARITANRFCGDCSRSHQFRMIQQDKCGHPEVDPEKEKDRAMFEDDMPHRKLGRPKKKPAMVMG